MNEQILKKFDLSDAIDSLKKSRPVIFPTETVYGLGAGVFDEEGIKQIFELKKRPADNPLIAHISDLSQVSLIAEEVPPGFYELAEAFWPGPLAMVVKKKSEVPSIASGGLDTIAIRMPAHPIALKLIQGFGPVVAPSANLSGKPSPTHLKDALEDLQTDVYLDGGSCEIGLESTVLCIEEERAVLLRPGKITKEEIEAVLKKPVVLAKENEIVRSPGMKYRHYAPNADVLITYTEESEALIPTEQTFYAELRNADRLGKSQIKLHVTKEVLANEALMNRLLKAVSK